MRAWDGAKPRWRLPMADFTIQRTKMVDGQIRTTDVTETRLLDALLSVPRELFVPEDRRALAYIDEDLEVAPANASGPARYLMEPSPFAKLVQLADIEPGNKVLSVGCGSGYGVAVLSRLAANVVALEVDPALVSAAKSALSETGVANVKVVAGPLPEGYAPDAPYDVIVVEGSVEVVPETLLQQLAEGGRMVVVVGRGNAGVARVYVKSGAVVSNRRGFNAAVKPLPGFNRTPAFEF
jgi:protein-L-isoaspartate(D-aspartate) O-methyltransferase